MSSSSSSAPIRTITEWDDEYARMARFAASQFRTTPGYSMKQQRTTPDINVFQQSLQRLDNALLSSPISSSLASTEVQRRRRLVQHLQQTTIPGSSGTVDLLGGATSNVSSNPNNAQQQQPQQSKMTMALRQQDDMIDQLAVGVNRLKQQTTIIGEEANMHVNLMNDIDDHLDTTYNTIHDQTLRTAALREDQSIWKLQLIIIALTILLVLEILAGLSP
jgi:hypothetical protein